MNGQYNGHLPNGRNQFGITPEDLDPQYWFGFRQVKPYQTGRALPQGPYGSFNEAQSTNEKMMGPDVVVSAPILVDIERLASVRAEELTGEE